jgi:hypothetical protein
MIIVLVAVAVIESPHSGPSFHTNATVVHHADGASTYV